MKSRIALSLFVLIAMTFTGCDTDAANTTEAPTPFPTDAPTPFPTDAPTDLNEPSAAPNSSSLTQSQVHFISSLMGIGFTLFQL